MGGEIWAESEPGKGSVFHFTIPCQPAVPVEKSAHGTVSSETRKHTEPLKILYIDDNRINARIAIAILGKLGFTAEEMPREIDFLDVMASNTYDIIVLDSNLQKENSPDLLAQVRCNLAPENRPPVIIMVDDPSDVVKEAWLESGADFVIDKPIQRAEILAALASVQKITANV
ncbi:unnamed protein product [Laminaria digitata]